MRRNKQFIILTILVFLVLFSIPAKSQAVKGTFLYTLSDFTGSIPYNWARVSVDKERKERNERNGIYIFILAKY